jgi:hypothetical protein
MTEPLNLRPLNLPPSSARAAMMSLRRKCFTRRCRTDQTGAAARPRGTDRDGRRKRNSLFRSMYSLFREKDSLLRKEQGISRRLFKSLRDFATVGARTAPTGRNWQNSLLFSLLSGNSALPWASPSSHDAPEARRSVRATAPSLPDTPRSRSCRHRRACPPPPSSAASRCRCERRS